jgi:hypothetical protein
MRFSGRGFAAPRDMMQTMADEREIARWVDPASACRRLFSIVSPELLSLARGPHRDRRSSSLRRELFLDCL